jgi:hypothetical protein
MRDVVVLGAGPYGLAAAAHLRDADIATQVFGEPMQFWQSHMPSGMLLRSYRQASHIADPRQERTLDAFEAATGRSSPQPVPLQHFVEYGTWFAEQTVPDVDRRRITRIERTNAHFALTLDDGEHLDARRVVVAAGIADFARVPTQGLPLERVSHSSFHHDLQRFAGARVVVVGGGQSALESAALLHEAGASVEVLVRAPTIHWLRYGSGSKLHSVVHSERNPLRPLLFPPSDIGPPGINLVVDQPPLFKSIPTQSLQDRVARRAIRPAGSGWLRARLSEVPITTGVHIVRARVDANDVDLLLGDGTKRSVDHVMLATGFAVDVTRHSFLPDELLRELRLVGGFPKLDANFASSIPGLHFIGAAAAFSFGPLMRFVAGTGFASRRLTRGIMLDRTTT